MENDPPKKRKHSWTIDESKCLSGNEVKKLRYAAIEERVMGLRNRKFSRVRIGLGLNTGLRVQEMTSLKNE